MQAALPIALLVGISLLFASRRSSIRLSEVAWPIDLSDILRIGQSVMDSRNAHGDPHYGIDIFAKSGTRVRSASAGTVIRVSDGRQSNKESSKRAGLWIDIRGDDGLIYRYLHLGEAFPSVGKKVNVGDIIGVIATANTSGLANDPHLHFEIRKQDWTEVRGSYGDPIDPLSMLPVRKG
ncbi:M23 family metallopeptidase [Haliangium sp. UPWRP_2]|uniref:M23 family metallopeptidase n=1 Tax=Haliangium sp. UPWRP_2 TaxID=1931276 RepID=UPI000B5483B6|nr:M23 family metallopeptidase [Haliangium sp. UPWRP_2]PSM31460.1 M23 family peptidase [Haliangium sp. UPWRP_2]